MFRKVFNVITTILLILLVAVVVLIFITRLTGGIPSAFGYRVFKVLTDSMSPVLEVDDVILVKETPAEEIHQGDIITYISQQGDLKGNTITHRVIAEPTLINGEYYFQTMGDKEGALPDPEIPYHVVQGKYIRKIPFLDKLYSFFLSPLGLICFIALIVILFGYEMISLILSYKAIDEKDDDYYEPKQKKPRHKRKKNKKSK